MEELSHSALHSLTILQLERETLHLRRPPSQITHSVLPRYLRVGDLDLQSLDLLGQSGSLSIIQLDAVSIKMTNVEELSSEVNDWLSFVECGGRNINVEGHLPVTGTNRLVKPKPDLSASSQRMIVVGWWREK